MRQLATPRSRVTVLVVPTHHERRAVLRALPGAQPAPGWGVPTWRRDSLLVVEPGIGPDRASAVLPRLDGQNVAALWLFGWCGGLSPGLDAGDLVLADATVRYNTVLRHPPPGVLQAQMRRMAKELGLRLVIGPVFTSNRVLASASDRQMSAATGALAVEMEAGPLSRWAAERGVLFVHLRVVLDPATTAAPEGHLSTNKHGSVMTAALGWYVLTHPRQWLALWRLVEQAGRTSRIMKRVIAFLAGPGGALTTTRQER